MPFSVLRVSKSVEMDVQVVGEFPSEEEATNFAGEQQRNDTTDRYEYQVESNFVPPPDIWAPPPPSQC